MKTQLLATFTSKKSIDDTIELIKKYYDIAFGKIYVFQNEEKTSDFICTYNVIIGEGKEVDYNILENTISIHRKKYSNTLYTINALNEVIKNLNNGVLDTSFNIPWENFQNMLLVVNKEGLCRISTRIFKIHKLN
tara:strand:- start:1888 stop:2292 length:405 start_codon:yes stop_codon:yes gene_type:complete